MSVSLQPFEVYALRYARHDERRASENFIGGHDPHDDPPMPLDFFVWALKGPNGVFVVDSGFDEATASKRQRTMISPVGDGLRRIGIDPATVKDVIVTHLHYDHAGNHGLFPDACYHLQEKEMAYSTGRCMCHAPLRHAYAVDDVTAMVRRVHDGRVRFHNGAAELAPGLTVHHVGGHTMGLQVVRVWTQRGWLVLASDASHYYANMDQGRPFPIVYNVADMLDGHRFVHAIASSPAHVIPGHDPLVLQRYPAPDPAHQGIVARLDVAPSA